MSFILNLTDTTDVIQLPLSSVKYTKHKKTSDNPGVSKEVKTGTVFFPSEEMLNVAKEVLISKTLNSAETFSNFSTTN